LNKPQGGNRLQDSGPDPVAGSVRFRLGLPADETPVAGLSSGPPNGCGRRPRPAPSHPHIIVNTYGVNRLDFDIEGSVIDDSAASTANGTAAQQWNLTS
jgi:hypothetical protein